MDPARLEAFSILLQDVRFWANDLLLMTGDFDTDENEERADRKLCLHEWAYRMFTASGRLSTFDNLFADPRRPIPRWPFPSLE